MKNKDLALVVFKAMIPTWTGSHFIYFYYDKERRKKTIKIWGKEIVELIENKIKLENL